MLDMKPATLDKATANFTNLEPSLNIWMGFRCSTAIHCQNPSCSVQSTETFPKYLLVLCQHRIYHCQCLTLSLYTARGTEAVVPVMYACSCSSTMLRRSAPCCWQLFLAWCHVSTACVFLWYWTPVTGSVSQPKDATLQKKFTSWKRLIHLSSAKISNKTSFDALFFVSITRPPLTIAFYLQLCFQCIINHVKFLKANFNKSAQKLVLPNHSVWCNIVKVRAK